MWCFYVNTHYLTLLVLFAKKKAHFPPENCLRLITAPKFSCVEIISKKNVKILLRFGREGK